MNESELLAEFNLIKEKIIKINTLLGINEKELNDLVTVLKDEYKITDFSDESLESERISREKETFDLFLQGEDLVNEIKKSLDLIEEIQ